MVNSRAQNLYDLDGKFHPGAGEVPIREILSQGAYISTNAHIKKLYDLDGKFSRPKFI
jgi:hypothetical protein